MSDSMISFFNVDFWKNVVSGIACTIVQLIFTWLVVRHYMRVRELTKYKAHIYPAMEKFIFMHKNMKNEIDSILITEEVYKKFAIYQEQIADVISIFNNNKIYMYYPDISKELVEYSVAQQGISKSIINEKFNAENFDYIMEIARRVTNKMYNITTNEKWCEILDMEYVLGLREQLEKSKWSS